MFAALLRLLFIRRLFRGGSRRRAGRRRSGFGMTGPFPSYSTRTRGGSRVSVGGCCLPIPLALALGTAGLGRVLTRR
jgi:hypothetical protein